MIFVNLIYLEIKDNKFWYSDKHVEFSHNPLLMITSILVIYILLDINLKPLKNSKNSNLEYKSKH